MNHILYSLNIENKVGEHYTMDKAYSLSYFLSLFSVFHGSNCLVVKLCETILTVWGSHMLLKKDHMNRMQSFLNKIWAEWNNIENILRMALKRVEMQQRMCYIYIYYLSMCQSYIYIFVKISLITFKLTE